MHDHIASPAFTRAALADPTHIADVLVVDDDESVRHVVLHALRRLGYRVASAADGRSAREALARQSFRLVITDIYMPDMDGYEIVMHLNRQVPRPAILAISGGSGREAAGGLRVAHLLGCEQTMTKPFDLADLQAVARRLIGAPTGAADAIAKPD